MKLYHGSTVIVENPEIEETNYNDNFEKGFYTSIDKDSAEYWAEEKKQKILDKNKTLAIKKYINVYEFTEDEELNILDFDKVNAADYRIARENKDNGESLHNYDVVKGPEINEELLKFLKEYKKKKLRKEELLNMLIIYQTINEISFHTKRGIKALKFLYAEEIKQ